MRDFFDLENLRLKYMFKSKIFPKVSIFLSRTSKMNNLWLFLTPDKTILFINIASKFKMCLTRRHNFFKNFNCLLMNWQMISTSRRCLELVWNIKSEIISEWNKNIDWVTLAKIVEGSFINSKWFYFYVIKSFLMKLIMAKSGQKASLLWVYSWCRQYYPTLLTDRIESIRKFFKDNTNLCSSRKIEDAQTRTAQIRARKTKCFSSRVISESSGKKEESFETRVDPLKGSHCFIAYFFIAIVVIQSSLYIFWMLEIIVRYSPRRG